MSLKSHTQMFLESIRNQTEFWTREANKLKWRRKWDQLVDESNAPFFKWFTGGELNACENCVDRHVEAGHGSEVAFIYDSPVTDTIRHVTFKEIQDITAKMAGVLDSWGLGRSSFVLIYMPMIPEAFAILLACARLGIVHNTVPGGLPADDLAIRIQHSEPAALVTASFGYHPQGWVNYKKIVDEAIELSTHKPEKCLVYQRPGMDHVEMANNRDVDWEKSLSSAIPQGCVSVPATDSMFMLYTSGSTGVPKAIVHSLGSYLVRMASDMDVLFPKPTESTIFCTSSLGWIVGHTLVMYGPMLNRIKTVMFEGDPLLLSDVRILYRVLDQHKVTLALLRPGVLRAVRANDPESNIAKEYDFTRLKSVVVGGEHVDIPTIEWTQKTFQTFVQNVWGQTECSSAVFGVPLAKGNEKYSMTGAPFLGHKLMVINTEDMTPTKPGEIGRMLIKFPLAPGMLQNLYKNEELFKKTYFEPFPGYFDTKDVGYVDDDGRFKMEHRADDIIKAGPIYVSSTAIEQKILENPSVAEVLVAAMPHNAYREIPVALIIERKGQKVMADKVVQSVRNHFGNSMPFETAVCVSDLPRTRTGKSHRPSIVNILKGIPDSVTGAVENPHVLNEIRNALRSAGLSNIS